MKKKALLVALLCGSLLNAGAADIQDAIQQVKKNNFEKAISIRAKVSKDGMTPQVKLLYDISESMLDNNPKYTGYSPLKAYDIYNRIIYSDYLTDSKVLLVLREEGIRMDDLRQQIEDNLMKDAKAQNTVAAYDEIIKACQGCSYLDDAKRAKDNLVFDNTLSGATLQEVQDFIDKYPDSPKRDQAIRMRDSLAYAHLSPSADAYLKYTVDYPNSAWTPKIKKEMEKMAYEEAKTIGTVNSYAKYIANFPDNTREVRDFEEKIKQQQAGLVWKVSPSYSEVRCVADTATGKSYILVKNGLWGILNSTGGQLVSPQFEDVGEVYNGQLIVKQGGRWGLANVETGTILYSPEATDKSDLKFLNKNFTALRSGGLWGLIYKGTQVAIAPFLSSSLNEHTCKMLTNGGVALSDGSNLKIAGPDGSSIFDKKYDEVSWRTSTDVDSRFIKLRNGKKYGIVSPAGKLMSEPQYDMMPFFDADGICSLKNLFTEGWMDTTGKFLYYGKLSSFKDCAGPDKMIAYEVEGKFGFLDKTGKNNIPLKYSGVDECFVDGVAKVRENGRVEYIDRSGRVLISESIGNGATMEVVDGLILVRDGSGVRFVNAQGNVFNVGSYDHIDGHVASNYLIVTKAGKKGAVDRSGQQVVPVKYDEMTRYCNDYSIVKVGGKYGLYYKNQLVLEPVYDRMLDPSHLFDNDCNAFADGKISDVIYLSVFTGTDNTKIVLKEGKKLFSTPDEVQLDKPLPNYTIVKTAAYGVFSDAKCALVGSKGEIIIKPTYTDIQYLPTKTGTYFAYKSDDKWGVLNSKGMVEVAAFADNIVSYDGATVVADYHGDRLCFDRNGIAALPKGYEVDGKVLKNKTTGKFGVIDSRGNIKIYPVYDKVLYVAPTYAVVLQNGQYGILNY
jgi:hypothetical protein